MKYIPILALAVLAGCAGIKDVPTVVYPGASMNVSPIGGAEVKQVKESVDIDPQLLQACPDLPAMSVVNPAPEDILAQKVVETRIYALCSARHRGLISVVREAFNLDIAIQ